MKQLWFFLLIGSTWKNQEAMKCQKVLSVFVCRAFIFQPIFYHTSVKLSLYTVVYYANIFYYASYHFQDIRGSKWDLHSKFRIFISSPSFFIRPQKMWLYYVTYSAETFLYGIYSFYRFRDRREPKVLFLWIKD